MLGGVCTIDDLFLCVDHGGEKMSQKLDVSRGKYDVVLGNVVFIIVLVRL